MMEMRATERGDEVLKARADTPAEAAAERRKRKEDIMSKRLFDGCEVRNAIVMGRWRWYLR
jgi:hypothetical protein